MCVYVCACTRAPAKPKGINSYMQGVRLCVCGLCAHVRERATTEPVLMASLRPVAAAVQIEWSPGVTALTEGGSFVFSHRMWGRQAVGRSIHKYRTGLGFSIGVFFHPPVVGGRICGISIREVEKRHYQVGFL